jgi:hypothetical protein
MVHPACSCLRLVAQSFETLLSSLRLVPLQTRTKLITDFPHADGTTVGVAVGVTGVNRFWSIACSGTPKRPICPNRQFVNAESVSQF